MQWFVCKYLVHRQNQHLRESRGCIHVLLRGFENVESFIIHPLATLPKYVFRGTTKNFPGGKAALSEGYTCTSAHPGKATLFSIECRHTFPNDAVIYIAESETLSGLDITENFFAKDEQEIIFAILPVAFYERAIGYVTLAEMQHALATIDHVVNHTARKDNLTELCQSLSPISNDELETLVKILRPQLKKL